jgi:hypothetical protein
MKTNTASVSVLGVLVIAALLVIGILKIQQAYAQVDATSSDVVVTSPTDTIPVAHATTSATADAATTDAMAIVSTNASTTVASDSMKPAELPPQGLIEVHIVGTKYIDYFTDGTTITAYPGDPKIDGNLNKPDAPIPVHEGLTWVHTAGGYLYDTKSGDLDVGEYAVQPNAAYIANARPFVSSTSTPAVLGESTSTPVTSPDNSSTSTRSDTADIIAPTTASSDSTTTTSNQ